MTLVPEPARRGLRSDSPQLDDHRETEGRVTCRVLTEIELQILRDRPELVRSPSELFNTLSHMVDNNRRAHDRLPPPDLCDDTDEDRKNKDEDRKNKYDDCLDLFDDLPPTYPPVFGR